MSEGAVATRLGLSSQPPEAESIAVSRDLALAEKTGGRIHICHISTRRSDRARAGGAGSRGVAVTCEVTPHHLFLTDEDVDRSGFDTSTKMNPPLRPADDAAALVEALVDGTIDAIATDHAPHHDDEKAVDYESAPFGVAGLETALSLVHNFLVVPGRLTISRFVELLSSGPARAFSLAGGRLRTGEPGDVVVFDPDAYLGSRCAPVRLPRSEHSVRGLEASSAGRARRSWAVFRFSDSRDRLSQAHRRRG